MARKRLKSSGNKTPEVQTKDLGIDGDLRGDAESTVCAGPPERENDRPIVPGAVGEIPTPATFPVSSGDAARTERSGAIAGVAPKSSTLSRTDQKFDEDRPGWYIFGKEVKDGNCWTCGKPFKTQLEMNRFCSTKCKNEYLATISPSKKITLESS